MQIVKSKKNLSGAKMEHMKNTAGTYTVQFPLPNVVEIPMIQHMGVACIPLVKKGDYVYVGQKIGESSEQFSAIIHSSCSGTVTDIVDYHTVAGVKALSVVIDTDGKQQLDEHIKPPTINNRKDFVDAIKQSGLVGLGGAGFPTHIKFAYKDIEKVDKLVINAAECEPYITSDYRECIENTDNIVAGIKAIQEYIGIKNVFIGIENNKPLAIKQLNNAFDGDSSVNVVSLKSIYPQGSEKSIIYATTGIIVPEGKLPADCGVIVSNVSSIGFVGKYIKDGVPLISKRITVDGDVVARPANLNVPIGTPVKEILDYCAVNIDCGKVLMGGPMMGLTVLNTDATILKNNNAIIVFSKEKSTSVETTACIRCSKCITVCPMKLMPAKLERAYDNENADMLDELGINICINCGCCTYICPAKRHLAQKNQLAKILLKNKRKGCSL